MALAAVGSLTRKNEDLALKAERMKERLLRDAGSMPLEERNALLAETDALLEETEQAGAESRSFMNLPPEDRTADVYAEIHELRAECAAMGREHSELREEAAQEKRLPERAQNMTGEQVAAALKQMREETQRQIQDLNAANLKHLQGEIQKLKEQNDSLREGKQQADARTAESSDQNQRLLQESARLAAENLSLQEQLDASRQSASGSAETLGPESRLRQVMTSRTATIRDMKQAVGSAEALVDEVRRELSRRVLSEKRAAIELLYQAIDKAEGTPLAAALERAREAEVDASDLEKGEAKLEEIRSMTEDQKIAKAAHLLEVDRKKKAFLLVKKDDAAALKEFIDSLEEGVRWQDWRDYAGRNMWKYSQELCAQAVRQLLREELGLGEEQQTRRRGSTLQEERYRQNLDEAQAAVKKHATELAKEEPAADKEKPEVSGPSDEGVAASAGAAREESPPPQARLSTISDFSADEERALQSSAQGAVVRDDAEALKAILDRVDVDVWSQWTNKAGKDLLTLSEERGSTTAYSFLASALGILTEQRRETFEERETVWVFFPGEVQARRATILEDTAEENDEIHVEMWEGSAGTQMVERCLVRKMGS